jgi:hypothetical protein
LCFDDKLQARTVILRLFFITNLRYHVPRSCFNYFGNSDALRDVGLNQRDWEIQERFISYLIFLKVCDVQHWKIFEKRRQLGQYRVYTSNAPNKFRVKTQENGQSAASSGAVRRPKLKNRNYSQFLIQVAEHDCQSF